LKTEGHSGSDLSTYVNDALMRPIKELQQATYFRRVDRNQLMASIDLYKSSYMIYSEQEDGWTKEIGSSISSLESDCEEDDLKSSYWMPVNLANLSKSQQERVM